MWGIGRYLADGKAVSLTVPMARMREETLHARWVLIELGVRPDRPIVLVFSTADGAQFAPFEYAARDLGVPYAAVEPSSYDAGRLLMYSRGLQPSAVIGLRDAVLDGLAELDVPIASGLDGVGPVVAFPGARDRLVEAGLPARRWLPLGPTVAIECGAGALHLSPAWEIDVVDGELIVSATDDAPELRRVRTGIRGVPVDGACDCAHDSPRVELEEDDGAGA